MPTAIEYGLITNFHTQNGCGSGPPALNTLHTQHGGQAQAAVAHPAAPPAVQSAEPLMTSPLVTLLLVAAVVAATRRTRRSLTPGTGTDAGTG
jgi:hypothetical protein